MPLRESVRTSYYEQVGTTCCNGRIFIAVMSPVYITIYDALYAPVNNLEEKHIYAAVNNLMYAYTT